MTTHSVETSTALRGYVGSLRKAIEALPVSLKLDENHINQPMVQRAAVLRVIDQHHAPDPLFAPEDVKLLEEIETSITEREEYGCTCHHPGCVESRAAFEKQVTDLQALRSRLSTLLPKNP